MLHTVISFANCRVASAVIPLLPMATFRPSIQSNLGLPHARADLVISKVVKIVVKGRVDDSSFFEYLSPFCFFVNWISLYFFHYKILPYFIHYYCNLVRGRVDDSSFFDCLSPFCFLSIQFHFTFSISYKLLPYFFSYYCI